MRRTWRHSARASTANVVGLVHTFAPFVAAMRTRGAARSSASRASRGSAACRGRARIRRRRPRSIAYLESLRIELRGSGVAVAHDLPGYISTPDDGAKNPYPMPFLLAVKARMRIVRRASSAGGDFTCCRGRWRSSERVLRILPRPIYDACLRARRASRGNPGERDQPRPSWRGGVALRAASAGRR